MPHEFPSLSPTSAPGRSAAAPESTGPVSGRPDPDLAVETRALTKRYRNPWTLKVQRGLESLDLRVRRGEVFGYLGPNGAGKTTTLKILTGLHKPTAGNAWLLGESIANTRSRVRLGFLPEQPYFYDYLSGVEYVEFAAQLSGLDGREAARRARQWIDRVGLGRSARVLLRKYSKGMLQRVGLAAALVHEPDLLILDEPMSGLDPFGRRDVRELILEQQERGATVMFSSHILPDVEQICDRVAILIDGRLTRVATVGELVDQGESRVEIRCAPMGTFEVPQALASVLERRASAHETVFHLGQADRLNEVMDWLMRRGTTIHAVTPQRQSLEDLFLNAAESQAPAVERRSA